ncbi:hypothetical protein [Paraflavitalea speifideaquila]|uniref:hypothetical protein n=1 Tax=Paraflavitalea speifideaquila TaxID=3076558 RepID=UPI0028E73FFA|nr:hypothetical protein [Paraflavitalea speifideiaquila]
MVSNLHLSGKFSTPQAGETIEFRKDETGPAFSWRSPTMDKVGTYRLYSSNGLYLLELQFNYAREATYQFTVLDKEGEMVTAFTLTDDAGRVVTAKKIGSNK